MHDNKLAELINHLDSAGGKFYTEQSEEFIKGRSIGMQLDIVAAVKVDGEEGLGVVKTFDLATVARLPELLNTRNLRFVEEGQQLDPLDHFNLAWGGTFNINPLSQEMIANIKSITVKISERSIGFDAVFFDDEMSVMSFSSPANVCDRIRFLGLMSSVSPETGAIANGWGCSYMIVIDRENNRVEAAPFEIPAPVTVE